MSARSSALTLVVTGALLMSCSVSGIGSGTPQSPSVQELTQRVVSHCTDLEAPELGLGKLCVDNGFRVASDDFSFANWGRSVQADANITIQTLIDLFGHNTVCMPGPTTECTVRPATTQKLEEWNNALSGGRCEGLATLSTRFHLQQEQPSAYQTTATRVSELNRDNEQLASSIAYWWATQFLPEVADRAAESRSKSPLELVDDLILGLANKAVGYTLGLYYGSSGHSVTPYAVTRRDESFVIHVYDNNSPGIRREVLVNGRDNTWRYPAAITARDGTPIEWSGSTGTLELTPMSARKGPFTCTFCTSPSAESPSVVTLASRDSSSPGYIYITTRNGQSIEATPTTVTNTIEGSTYAVGKNAQSGLATITIPSTIKDFDVQVRRTSSSVPAADVVLGIRRAGSASIQVSGNLAQTVIGDQKITTSVLSVRTDNTTINAPASSTARVSVASESRLSRTTLRNGMSLIVSRISNNTIDVALKGSDGTEFGSAPLAIHATDFVTDTQLTLSNQQNLVVTDLRTTAIRVSEQNNRFSLPRQKPQPTASSTSTVPSIEIALPD
jgi:hypothetical protein